MADCTSSLIYSAPITVSSTETINALAVVTGYFVWYGIAANYGAYVISPDVSATYTINLPAAATPTFSVPSGTYTSAQTVTLSDSTPGAIIRYTTNGVTPTANSQEYTQPIAVSSSETIEAIAVASGYSTSAVASAQYTLNLPQPDFSVAASPASLTVKAGSNVTSTIKITPQNGFNNQVQFSCSGLPSNTYCNFSPSAVTPSGSTVSATLTIETTSATVALTWLPGSALACVFGFFFWKKKRLRAFWLLLLVAGGVTFIGCGGGSMGGSSSTSTQQPVNATVTIKALSGSLQHVATISLTVDP